MKIYLAGNPKQHEQFDGYARELETMGHEVVSTWHQSGMIADLIGQWWQWIGVQQSAGRDLLDSLTKGKLPELDPTRFSVPPGFNEQVEDVLQTSKKEIDTADWVIVDLDGGSMEAGYALASGKKLITFGRARSPLSFMCVEYAPAAADWQGALGTLMNKTRPRIGRSLSTT